MTVYTHYQNLETGQRSVSMVYGCKFISGANLLNLLNFNLDKESEISLWMPKTWRAKTLQLNMSPFNVSNLIRCMQCAQLDTKLLIICTTASLSQKTMIRMFASCFFQVKIPVHKAYNSKYSMEGEYIFTKPPSHFAQIHCLLVSRQSRAQDWHWHLKRISVYQH